MKKVLIPVVGTLGAGVIVVSGLSNFVKADPVAAPLEHQVISSAGIEASPNVSLSPSLNPTDSAGSPGNAKANPPAASAEHQFTSPAGKEATPNVSLSPSSSKSTVDQQTSPGLVGIHYKLYHLSRIASNQLAIWIEDEQGHYVKTLFATSFTANGGYTKRPESLPEWRKAADWENASKEVIKRVSRPEQQEGDHTVYWDCTDESGSPVKPGTYVYKMEGNIQWENRVVYSGTITVGDRKTSATATAAYFPEDAMDKGTLLEQVKADFSPGETMDASKMEAATQTRGS